MKRGLLSIIVTYHLFLIVCIFFYMKGTVALASGGRHDQNSRSYSHVHYHLTIPILRWIVLHTIHHNSVAVDCAVKSLLAAHCEGLFRKAAADDYCENSGETE